MLSIRNRELEGDYPSSACPAIKIWRIHCHPPREITPAMPATGSQLVREALTSASVLEELGCSPDELTISQ